MALPFATNSSFERCLVARTIFLPAAIAEFERERQSEGPKTRTTFPLERVGQVRGLSVEEAARSLGVSR